MPRDDDHPRRRRVILVTGATGNVGSEVVDQLIAANVPVQCLVRRRDGKLPARAEPVHGDLNEPDSVAPALANVEAVFLLSGYPTMSTLLRLIRDAGIERLVLRSGGAAVATNVNNTISRYMISSERAVHEAGVAWTILRPYMFMSNTLRWMPQLQAGDVVRTPFARVANAVIDPHDIAKVAAAALLGDHAGRTYRLPGPEPLRPGDQVRTLGKVLGRNLVSEPQSDEEAWIEMMQSMPREYIEAVLSFYADGTLHESHVLHTVEEITGTSPRTLDEWARTTRTRSDELGLAQVRPNCLCDRRQPRDRTRDRKTTRPHRP